MESNVLDIHGNNIKLGDKVKFWFFYNSAMNSEDCCGTEPQNSFTVYEEYMEFVAGEIVFYLGAFCIKYGKEIYSIKEIIEKTPNEFVDFYMFDFGGKLCFDDWDFWGEDFEGKLPKSEELTHEEFELYWGTIKNHLSKRCSEFEIIT